MIFPTFSDLLAISEIDSNAFYVVEQARDVSKVLKPVCSPLGGWRQRNKQEIVRQG
jgi:hypothetical protein